MESPAGAAAILATSAGAGLIVFMVVWLLGSRIFGAVLAAPAAPNAAMAVAIVSGVVAISSRCAD